MFQEPGLEPGDIIIVLDEKAHPVSLPPPIWKNKRVRACV